MAPLETLVFENSVLAELPVDESGVNEPRQVRGAVYALVQPTPLADPRLVVASPHALSLLGLDADQADRPELVSVLAGNVVLSGQGSRPAAHCYAGFQFGSFAGQLGDGAAIYLGEVVHPDTGLRQELQLKGAGPTPFRRHGDGRKVLRSSLREFLASEAMAALGIPTTRAGSLVVSGSDTVLRDSTYSGRAAPEPCAVVSRIAPTFLRFGSFEICRPTDALTGQAGPSAGQEGSLLPRLLAYTLSHHFSHLWAAFAGGQGADISLAHMSDTQVRDLAEAFFEEVCRATARLAAAWQSVGFTHGVLNTDNMSITGLTIDYGPFGFMDRFDPAFVPNGSDDAGRYSYKDQPAICRENCARLGEALASIPVPSAAAAAAAAVAAAAAAAGGAAGADARGGGGTGGGSPAGEGGGAAGAGAGAGAAARSLLPPGGVRKGLAAYDEEYARSYRGIFRRKLGLLGNTAAKAAGGTPPPPPAAAAAAAGAGPAAGAARPTWPLAADASPQVVAAAGAVTSLPPQPGVDGEDDALVAQLLTVMEETGADFTNTFRRLALVPLPPPSKEQEAGAGGDQQPGSSTSDGGASSSAAAAAAAGGGDYGGFLPQQLAELPTPAEMQATSKPSMPLEQLQMLMMVAGRDAATLHALGIPPGMLTQALSRHKTAAAWARTTPEAKAESDAAKWCTWLAAYSKRLEREVNAGVPAELRQAVMLATSPRVVLRNWVAQTAIAAAEAGHYDTPRGLLALLQQPYSSAGDASLQVPAAAAAAGAAAAAAPRGGEQEQQEGVCVRTVTVRFDGKPPAWARGLCVTCSS